MIVNDRTAFLSFFDEMKNYEKKKKTFILPNYINHF